MVFAKLWVSLSCFLIVEEVGGVGLLQIEGVARVVNLFELWLAPSAGNRT